MQPKTLQEVTIDVRELYNKTLKSSARLDLETGIEMFLPLLKREPALVPAREKLRELEHRKTEAMGVVAIFFANLLSLPKIYLKINKLIETDPNQAMQLCEDLLAKCLNNRFALAALARAAAELDAYFIGIEAVIQLRRFWSEDTMALEFCAQYLVDAGRPEDAARIYQEMINQDPSNGKLKTMLREALAVATMENDGSNTKTIQTRDSAEAIAQQLMDGTIHDAEQAKVLIDKYNKMLKEKDSVDVRRRLADAYMVAEDYDNVIANLELVAEKLGAMDPALDKAIEKAYIARYNQAIQKLEKDPGACENAEEQKADCIRRRDEYVISKAEARVEAYPNDLQLHYDLALLYFEKGCTDKALEQFQSARNHPQRRIISQYYIGRCLADRGMNDMAIEQLSAAIEGTPKSDRMRKEMIYYLALNLEKCGRKEEALAKFKELYQEDISFKDVESHIRELSK